MSELKEEFMSDLGGILDGEGEIESNTDSGAKVSYGEDRYFLRIGESLGDKLQVIVFPLGNGVVKQQDSEEYIRSDIYDLAEEVYSSIRS